jgi:hypothetical protein
MGQLDGGFTYSPDVSPMQPVSYIFRRISHRMKVAPGDELRVFNRIQAGRQVIACQIASNSDPFSRPILTPL